VILGVLKKLNIDAGNADLHEHHFHIDFRTPDRVDITTPPKKLMANAESATPATLLADWVKQAQTDFEQETGEIAMLAFDTTAVPDAGVMVVAQAPRASASTKERVFGICLPFQYVAHGEQQHGGEGGISPARMAISYFKRYENLTFAESEYPDSVKDVRIVRQPTHGRVTYEPIEGSKEVFWRYTPQAGYEGQDRVDFVVQVKGQPVRLVYYMQVTKKNLDTTPDEEFCKQPLWKISLDAPDASSADLVAWQRSADLSALIARAGQSLTGFFDLDGTAVGNTIGEGPRNRGIRHEAFYGVN
jgi:hypothetical protein